MAQLKTFATGDVATFTGWHWTSDFVVEVDGDHARSRCYPMPAINAGGSTLSLTARGRRCLAP
jgi:hypothetical protein